jgi:hypothetical protein
MRVIITTFSIAAVLAAADPAAAQAGKSASGKPAIRACDVLTPEMVAKYDTQDPKLRKLIPREEEAMGTHGSSCDDGGIRIQVNPFANSDTYRKKPEKDWVPVSGVGDTAYFHNNRNRWAELIVWSGSHHFTIQLSVPNGGTAESVKPNTIGLATAIVAKLKSL